MAYPSKFCCNLPTKTRLVVAFAAASLFLPPTAEAETLSRSYAYFTIGGKTPQEMEEQLSTLGPQLNGAGARHPGATRMEFSSSVGYRQEGGKCHVASAHVTIKAKIILPRWRRARQAETASRLFWEALSSDIVRHEESHLVIARNHARELETRLKRLRREATCEILAQKAEAEKEKVMAEHDKAQQLFDRIESKSVDKRLLSKLKRAIERLTQAQ